MAVVVAVLFAVPQLWLIAWFVLLAATVVAAIPPLHARFLSTIGWRHIPLVGRTSGIAATLVIATSSCGALVAGAAAVPPASPTPIPVVSASSQSARAVAAERGTPATSVPAVSAPTTPTPVPTSARQRARVLSVTDGDTVRVSIDGRSVPVRYIGIDTPETVDPRTSVQCFGKEASTFNSSLVAGQTVELEKDISETDKYDRLLRYVWVGDKMVNEELVRGGYATSSSYPPDVKYQDRFRALEAEARAKAVGLWAPNACPAATPTPTVPPALTPAVTPAPTQRTTIVPLLPPVPTRSVTPPLVTANPRAGCDPSYPTVCIPPAPPDLDCGEIRFRNFRVLPPDPHRFDGDRDGIGCEN